MTCKHIVLFNTVPNGPPQELVVSLTSHTIVLSWSPPLLSQRNGVITSYLISCSSGDIIINTTRTSSTSLTITGLEPFTNYTCFVSAATVSGDGPAAVIHTMTNEGSEFIYLLPHFVFIIIINTVPETSAANYSLSSQNSTLVIINWTPPVKPNGVIIAYQLQCFGGDQEYKWTVWGPQTTATLNGLLPYTNYSCSITAHTSVGGGPAATTSVTTEQDGKSSCVRVWAFVNKQLFLNYCIAPSGPPQDFIIAVTSHSINLTWSSPLPLQRNGVITSYLINCSSGDSIINTTRTSSTSLTITGLEPFTNYTCSVSASTVVGDGPAVIIQTMTAEYGNK